MAFQLSEFINTFGESPCLGSLEELRKSDLLELSKHFDLEAKQQMRKSEILRIVVEHLVDENVLPNEVLNILPEPLSSAEIELKKMEIRLQFELEEKRLKSGLEEKRLKSEQAIKEKRLKSEQEIEEKRLKSEQEEKRLKSEQETAIRLKELELGVSVSSHEPKFDLGKHIRLVPPFQEKAVDKYFQQFENLAGTLEWPSKYWTTLLQGVLFGKAQEIFSALSIEQSSDYEYVKKRVLNAYELVPEAYRLKFRNYKKYDNQTYVEYAREKESLFDRWCASTKVHGNYDKLRELILIEEFKQSLPVNLRTYINEQAVDKYHQASVLADEYALTHKDLNVRSQSQRVTPRNNNPGSKHNESVGAPADKKHAEPHFRAKPNNQGFSKLVCAYCKKSGHLISDCFKLKHKNASSESIAFVKSSPNTLSVEACPFYPAVTSKAVRSDDSVEDGYKPFVTEGIVSLVDDINSKPIKILRDTGASQSLISEDVLKFSEKSFIGASVLISGVECGVASVPLHRVSLQSELVSGPVVVGVRKFLPVEGVSLLLGNDLAGSKVVPEPRVVDIPSFEDSTEQLVEEFPEVFTACAVTRSQSHCFKHHDDIDLSDTFLSKLDANFWTESSSSSDTGEFSSSLDRSKLVAEQESDPEIISLSQCALEESEAGTVPVCYYKKSGVLMRKWRPPDVSRDEQWCIVYQIVVPKSYRKDILSLAHDHRLSGHLGIRKTLDRVRRHFYWPKVRQDVVEYCRTCHLCQVMGKSGQVIPKAPLRPIPALGEPFSEVVIDCVGPMPKSRAGNQYLLTIMCTATRFPEAIPLRNITARSVTRALIKFFTTFGLPKSVQSDQGSNFLSNVFSASVT